MLCLQHCRKLPEDGEAAVKLCQALLAETNVDNAVRLGDIYGLMIEFYARKEKWQAVGEQA